MIQRAWRRMAVMLVAWFLSCALQAAEVPVAKPLRVAVYVEEPFVMRTAGGFTGFSMDLWQAIADARGWSCEYFEVLNLRDLISVVHEGKADVAVTDLFITRRRLEHIDFTLPYYDSGLQIMVHSERRQGLDSLIEGLHQAGHLRVFAFGALAILVLSGLLTVMERRTNPELVRNWFEGFAHSFYHIMSLVMTGKTDHKGLFPSALGRLFAGLWLACGVAVIAYVTSSVTSIMTANHIMGQINGPADLANKTVGTIRGSSGETFVRTSRLRIKLYDNIDEAVAALVARDIDAIVYDSPILLYYDNKHPELPIKEVGSIFDQKKYGFGLPTGSPIRHAINEELIGLIESGYVEKLQGKYFNQND